ncbi:hypothetical protein [Nocardia sp. NPDC049526]|uniref:hypothetical protein n=1 Tax=Nocardia sp. NPDC049526 TaxID=3364316 RepID=UPI0037896E4A
MVAAIGVVNGLVAAHAEHFATKALRGNFGHIVAKAYAGHADTHTNGATTIYTRAGIEECALALAVMTVAPPRPRRRHHSPRRSQGVDETELKPDRSDPAQ